jgi:SnoaL-like domain
MTDTAAEAVSAAGAPRIVEILGLFVEGFNHNSLDEVMDFFAEHAVYEPGDGRTHRGRAAIREAFRPQFENAFGTMRFVVNDRVVDEGARKATIRWVCQHDFATMKPFPKRWFFKALFGRRAGWYGTDTFHFDERGKIVGKFSYANYGRRPHVRRDLGGA